MRSLGGHIRTEDWKKEKHVPVIVAPDKVKANEMFEVRITLGKEIAHPNTTEHHIRWVALYFWPEGGQYPYEVIHSTFNAHGESVDGPNKGPVYTHHEAIACMKIAKPGILHSLAYCNIHGLWEFSKPIAVE